MTCRAALLGARLSGVLLVVFLAGPAAPVRADDGGSPEAPEYLELLDHGDIDVRPGWRHGARLQEDLDRAIEKMGLADLADSGRLGVALVDLSGAKPVVAEVNGTRTLYAASVPKIAVLYAAFQAEREGRLTLDPAFRSTLSRMIRVSSNEAASEAIHRIGFPYIASVLWQSGLYDPDMGGGLWVGKAYGGPGDRWHRDPVANTSHGASALSLARLLTLLAQERLVDARASREMKGMLGSPGIHHKFVRGLETARPGSRVFRKSGTWRRWHGDAALVERGPTRYVAVALCEDDEGGRILSELIVALDDCVARDGDELPRLGL